MRIYLKAVCPEILGAFPSQWYEIDDVRSAHDALIACLNKYGGDDVKYESINRLIFMLNGKHISSDTIISDNDHLMVLRPVYGG